MGYKIEFSHRASKQFGDLPGDVQRRLVPRIDALSDDPRPHNCVKLEGIKNAYRIRVGDYRVVYQVQDDLEVIEITRIGHRRDIYRGL